MSLTALLSREGSTRAMGVFRILLVFILWSRWAAELRPFESSDLGLRLVGVAFYSSTTALLLGVWTRVSAAAVAVVIAVMVVGFGWYGDQHSWIHHHTVLLLHCAVLLTLTPCGRSFSFDRWWAVRRAQQQGTSPPPESGPLWAVPLLALQCSTVYLFSAFDKLSWSFLSGAHLQGVLATFYTGSDPVTVPGFAALLCGASLLVVLVELVLPFALFVRRWQWWAIPLGLTVHGLFYVAIPVTTFSVTVAALYLAYLHPEDVKKHTDRLFN